MFEMQLFLPLFLERGKDHDYLSPTENSSPIRVTREKRQPIFIVPAGCCTIVTITIAPSNNTELASQMRKKNPL